MNKIRTCLLAFCLCLASFSGYSQEHTRGNVVVTGNQDGNLFYHTIERGQTVYAIATMYGVSVEDIYRLNPESKEGIRAGSTLKIPQRNAAISPAKVKPGANYIYHTILRKETLYSLSVRYQVPAEEIIRVNPGLSTETFSFGKTIRIPVMKKQSASTTPAQKTTKQIIEYEVKKNETMYRICRKFDVSSAELIKLNPQLKEGVKAGMILKVPTTTTVTDDTENNVEQTPGKVPVPAEESVINALLSAPKVVKRVDRIQVALLLPFMTNESVPSSTTARFIEYYEGMLLAVDSLRKQGCSIELSVYDTGHGTTKVNEILQEQALKNASLIIGAVQNEQIGPVADFAEKHNIKYVIPFTSKNDDVLSNACVFQVNTPHSYLYSKAAQAGCNLFDKDNIILVKTNDKQQKPEFIKAFKGEMQQRNIPFKELAYNAETYATDIEALLDSTRRNVILPISSSLDAINKISPTLRMLRETRPVLNISLFGYPEWQTYTRECLDDFYALNTYIYSNFYADNLSPDVHNFYTLYKNWYSKDLINTFPKYGILGFDTGMFFLNAIWKQGSNFENNLNKIHYKSLQTSFDFHRVNNWGGFINTQLFIVHYKNDFTVTRSEVK